ncbi:MAG: hypothetical protein AAGA77_19580 [Bacteroidota bacterium]
MKLNLILSIFLAGILMLPSCSEKSVPVKNNAQLKKPEVGDKLPEGMASEIFDKAPITNDGAPTLQEPKEDCHGKRNIVQNLEEVEGSIMNVANRFVIVTNNGTSRYNPCKLPDKLKKEGMPIRFSGDVLEILPGERLAATPFRLRNIVEREK